MTHIDASRASATLSADIGAVRYLDALECQDFDTLEAIWKQAETDPELAKALDAVNAELVLEQVAEPRPATPPPDPRLDALRSDVAGHSQRQPQQAIEATYADYRCRVLVVDDEAFVRDLLRGMLSREFDVVVASSPAEARARFEEHPPDILLTDMCLVGRGPPDLSGIDLMEWARQRSPRTVALLMTGYEQPQSLVEAINRGHAFHYIAKPFSSLDTMQAVRHAARTFILERRNQELLECLKDLNMELEEKVRQRAAELLERMRELDQKNRTLEKLCLTDQLTGLPNRRAMDYLAERDLVWRWRNPAPLAIGLVDIDLFKNVNTKHGWTGGDRVLTEVARRLSASLRDIDHIGRYGGEEFMLIAPQADRHGAAILAERLRKEVEATPVTYRGQSVPVTVSIGVAVVECEGAADLDRMKDACEAALATAKADGRNRFVINTLPVMAMPVIKRAR